jgi:hypothetical protein
MMHQNLFGSMHDRLFGMYDKCSYLLEVAHRALDIEGTNPGCPLPQTKAALLLAVEQIEQAMFGGLGSNTDPPV